MTPSTTLYASCMLLFATNLVACSAPATSPSSFALYQRSRNVECLDSIQSGGRVDNGIVPLMKPAPTYPRRAQTSGVQGYCAIEYSVLKDGTTAGHVPVDCMPRGVFEFSSVQAAEKFRYKPQMVGGQPVTTHCVRNRFTFTLEGEPLPASLEGVSAVADGRTAPASGLQFARTDDESSLAAGVAAILASPTERDPLGTKDNFVAKAKERLSPFDGTLYVISKPIRNPQNTRSTSVSFDPEASELVISFIYEMSYPGVQFEGELDYTAGVYYDYIELNRGDFETRRYEASNAFGKTVTIQGSKKSSSGIAVLGGPCTSYASCEKPGFRIQVDRETARAVLDGGRYDLELFVDTEIVGIKDPAPLLYYRSYQEPKIDYPIESEVIRFMLPMRLLRVRLFDNAGTPIASFENNNVNANPIAP